MTPATGNLAANSGQSLTIVVIGASGDLARKKVLPALFALYCQGLLSKRSSIVGFARRKMSAQAFRTLAAEHVTCRYTPGESCADRMDEFLARCTYVSGQYDLADSFLDLYAAMRELEGHGAANRVFYMAIPPFLFLPVARSIGDAGLVSCEPGSPWSRVVIEKPFGRGRRLSLFEGFRLTTACPELRASVDRSRALIGFTARNTHSLRVAGLSRPISPISL